MKPMLCESLIIGIDPRVNIIVVMGDGSQSMKFYKTGIDPRVNIILVLKLIPKYGLIPMPYFSSHWNQSQLHHIQDFGSDPNAFFFLNIEYSRHWD